VSGNGISWAICKSAPRSRQITMPATHHSVFYRPGALPAAQPTASKHWRNMHHTTIKLKRSQNWSLSDPTWKSATSHGGNGRGELEKKRIRGHARNGEGNAGRQCKVGIQTHLTPNRRQWTSKESSEIRNQPERRAKLRFRSESTHQNVFEFDVAVDKSLSMEITHSLYDIQCHSQSAAHRVLQWVCHGMEYRNKPVCLARSVNARLHQIQCHPQSTADRQICCLRVKVLCIIRHEKKGSHNFGREKIPDFSMTFNYLFLTNSTDVVTINSIKVVLLTAYKNR